jgi:hypothetical protein
MAREELQAASEALREAAAAAPDVDTEERLYEQSRQFADLATADRGPDHGRLARHENVLKEALDELEGEGEATEKVESALDHITEYRSDVPGV